MTDLAYILAASHSGSTLLAMLLGAHPEAVTVGELGPGSFGDVARYRCSCRSNLLECPFWTQVAVEMKRRGVDFDLAAFDTRFRDCGGPVARRLLRPLYRGRTLEALRDVCLGMMPSWRTVYPRLVRTNRTLIEVVSAIAGARVVIDSSKTGVRLKYLLRIPELRIKVIRLIRDGRGVALTYMDPAGFADACDPAMRGGGGGADRDDERLTIAAAAREWRRSNEEAEHLRARFQPDRWAEVRYEDLCTDPGVTLGRLFEFLGLDADPSALDFRSVEHHVIGNGMRLDATSEITLDERWRSVLTKEQLAEFDVVAGGLNRGYGYL